MCGIAGIWRFNQQVDPDEIRAFTDSMKHRGPDDAGYELFENNTMSLGHRRLSILDLSPAGKQPMSYADQRYWLTFNGEIYNFIELRKELISKGYVFKSDTDSEVILASYMEWGTDCFQKFNGMWAMGIWDTAKKELLLCRDRFGVKPLHYCYIQGDLFAFASETIAFRHLKNFGRAYDHDNLVRAMHQHNILEPSGKTIYKNIFQVLPGNYAIIKSDQTLLHHKWWKTTDHFQPVPASFEEQKEQFLFLLEDACKIRLRSDVPIATALSGGVDSTSVYCMLNRIMKNSPGLRTPKDWQRAFSISFPGSQVDERSYIESVLSQTKGVGLITEPSDTNLASELELSTGMSDLISGTPLSSLTYVYKSMRENGISVSLDGHGVDEYLYGYNSSVAQALKQAYVDQNKEYSMQLEKTILEMNFKANGPPIIQKMKEQADATLKYRQSIKYTLKNVARRFVPNAAPGYTLPHYEADGFFNKVGSSETIPGVELYYNLNKNSGEQRLLEEFHYTELPYNLRDFDRGSMQNTIEIRMPFLDYRLVTYTMSLPQKSKLNNGFTKHILREAMKGIIPENIRHRKLKIGLGAPLKDWFNGGLSSYLPELVNSSKQDTSFFNKKTLQHTVNYNCMNKAWTDDSANQYWPIINYLLLHL